MRVSAVIVFFGFSTIVLAQDDIVPFATLPDVTIIGRQIGTSRVFARKDIAASGARTVAEFLSQQSFSAMRDDQASGGKQFARINGSNVNQVMVLVDGVRISDIGSGETDLARIPIDWIESIEVSSGGSAEFGAESIGGVISIRTTSGHKNSFEFSASGSETLGAYGVKQAWSSSNSSASMGVVRTEGKGNYRYRVTEEDGNGPYTLNLGEEFRRSNNQLVRDQFVGKFQHDIGRHTIGLTGWFDRSEFGLPGYLAPRPTPLANQRESFRHAQVDWSAPTILGRVNATGAVQDQAREFSDPDVFSYLHESHEVTKRWTGAANLDRQIAGVAIHASGRVERESIESGVIENDRASRNRWLVSGLASKSVNLGGSNRDMVELQAGINCERFGDSEIQFLPSCNMSYSSKHRVPFSVGAGTSRAYLAPGFYSLFWNDELIAQGNPNLRPESSSLLFGFARVESASKFRSTLEVRANRNQVDDLIYWHQAFDGRWTPQNLREASVKELTAEIRQVLYPGRIDISASMQWLDARDRSGERTTDGKVLTYRPARTFRASTSGEFGSYQMRLEAKSVGEQAILETNSKWLSGYNLLDAGISRKFSWKSAACEAGLRCSNVLNSDYRIVRFAPMPLREFSFYLNCNLGRVL